MSTSQDYESFLQEQNAQLSEQLGRAKAHIETLIKVAEQGWRKDDPAYRIALESAQRFLDAGTSGT